ncbi:MAG: hypothetical protein HKN18_04845 [Silicimonas sp.]|nr:hypothetical protein [Silicimonas sp.]
MITRRDTAKLVLAGAAMPLVPRAAFARQPEDWARLLQRRLDEHLVTGCDGKLTLVQFGMARRSGKSYMVGAIRLDWPPGYRSREFRADGPDDQAVFDHLLNLALFNFAKVWPGCVV